jgi:hypothetical protein
MQMRRTNLFWKYEKYIFAVFVLITAIPILANAYFPTVDGPAHLHNANLLKQFWFKGATNISDFFDFNKHLNSNFVDHIWFAVGGLFLPTFLLEKSIILFYIIALPYSFRYFVKKISGNRNSASISSYLIFSFVYSFTFRIGFYNFCIGIPLLFWTLGLWFNDRENPSKKRIILLCGMTVLLYAAHIFHFIVFGIIVFSIELQYILVAGIKKGLIRKLFLPALIMLPGVIMTIIFLLSNNSFEHTPPSYLPLEKLVQMILDNSPAITLSYERELIFARIIACSIVVLILFVIYNFIKKRKTTTPVFRPFWIVPTMIVLIIYFVFPDWVVSGGFISIRWALFFYLLLIILIAGKELSVKQLTGPVAVLLITHLFFIQYHDEETAKLSEDAEILVDAEDYMDDNTVLLPLSYSTNWIHINHANYMATTKNIINLDNYEPTKPHFPLIWKKGEIVYDLMPKYGNRNPPCINIDNYEKKTHHRIDYLSRFYFNGDLSDSCSALVEKEVLSRFELIYESENKKLQLYKRKPNT